MSTPFRLSAVCVILTALLAACAGGGGGGGGFSPPATPGTSAQVDPVPFTSFSAIDPDQRVAMSGIAQAGSGAGNAFSVDKSTEAASVLLPYDTGRYLTGLTLNTPKSSLSFDTTRDDWGTCSTLVCNFGNAALTSEAFLQNPEGHGWDYQSFGVWMSNPSTSNFQAGAVSVGAATPGSAVPTTGVANFTGRAGGYYFDGAGGRFATDAEMNAAVNFSARSIDFQTLGTRVTQPGASGVLNEGLNLSGTLNYAAGVNQFSGAVATQDKALSGTANGRFYGPNAQEIGGTYGLSAPSGAGMVGGFGGKKQ